MILDIHTHSLSPDPCAIIDISVAPEDIESKLHIPEGYGPEQRFSVGIHPWLLKEDVSDDMYGIIEELAARPEIAVIGEAGIDLPKGGPLFRQMLVFKKLVEISERVKKPLLIHNVKANEIIIGIHKEMRPSQPWIIHGFRSKPTVAQMMLREGFHLSFGPLFNPVTVHNTPPERLLAETDDSGLPISEVLHRISDARGTDITHYVAENTQTLFKPD